MPDLMRRRVGFTILELLMVMVVLGLLTTIAIIKFGDSRRRAYLTAMKSDLRNIGMTAESRFTSDNSYVGLEPPPGSAGVTLTFAGTETGWSATATHSGVPGVTCSLAAGSAAAPAAPREPVCQ